MENGGLLLVGILILMFIVYTMLNPQPKKPTNDEKPQPKEKEKKEKPQPKEEEKKEKPSSSVRMKPGTYEINVKDCIPADKPIPPEFNSYDATIKFSVINDRQVAINIRANATGTDPTTNASVITRADADSGCLAYTVSADGKSLKVAPPKKLKGVYLNGVYTEIPAGVSESAKPFPILINADGTLMDPVAEAERLAGELAASCKYKMIPGNPPACKNRVDINYSFLENGRPVTVQELFTRSFTDAGWTVNTSSPGITTYSYSS